MHIQCFWFTQLSWSLSSNSSISSDGFGPSLWRFKHVLQLREPSRSCKRARKACEGDLVLACFNDGSSSQTCVRLGGHAEAPVLHSMREVYYHSVGILKALVCMSLLDIRFRLQRLPLARNFPRGCRNKTILQEPYKNATSFTIPDIVYTCKSMGWWILRVFDSIAPVWKSKGRRVKCLSLPHPYFDRYHALHHGARF